MRKEIKMAPFNFTNFLDTLKLAPYVAAGVNQIHSDASTETKTQIATEALQLAAGVAGTVLPGEAALVGVAAQITQMVIGLFSHPSVTIPASVPASVPTAVKG